MWVSTRGSLVLCALLATGGLPASAVQNGAPVPGTDLYTIWSVDQLSKPGSLGNYGHYRASVQRREVGSAPEVHTDFAHVLIFTSGEGNVVFGGQIVDGPDGKKVVQGGESLKVVLGAVYHIPANTVHWVVPIPGTSITYWVTNINAPPAKP